MRTKPRYDVFVRDWWRFNEYGLKIPYPGAPREYLARDVTYRVAREMCSDWNSTHDPGEVSRKAEFELC